jgi:hypothetical protein
MRSPLSFGEIVMKEIDYTLGRVCPALFEKNTLRISCQETDNIRESTSRNGEIKKASLKRKDQAFDADT